MKTFVIQFVKKFLTGNLVVLALVFSLLGVTSVNAQPPARPGIFYAVSGNGLKDTSYLLGTYHLIKSDYLTHMPHVQKALVQSKGVVVEVVIDSAKLPAVQTMSLLKDKTLRGFFPATFADSLDKELHSSLGVGIEQVNQLKPATVSLTLAMVYALKNNAGKLNQYGGSPLDVYFADFGKKQSKTVTPLETVEEQMDLLFNKISEKEQADALKTFVRHKKEMVQVGDETLQSWFDNDLGKMDSLYVSYARLSGDMDYLVKERNFKWMTVLPGLIQQQQQFIAVGALHLAGNDGLVNQLRKKGYTVTPINL
jgi:uncharacterized protein YbaP (TraB family)